MDELAADADGGDGVVLYGGQRVCGVGMPRAEAQGAVCEAANAVAAEAMKARGVEAVAVMQDVDSGALVMFAASEPARLDVSTAVLPLSLSKVFLAASWWDRRQPGDGVDIADMIAGGSDAAGRKAAAALRKAVGTEAVMADLRRYGFNRGDAPFWAEVDAEWRKRLTPERAVARLDALNEADWSSALSIGESDMTTTAQDVSRFLQAVGNGGMGCAAVARRGKRGSKRAACGSPVRVVEEDTARQLMAAMPETVTRGSARRMAHALDGTGWAMGGKTGTGGRPDAPMEKQDGWFAGLLFDERGKARYTVATFVRQGGLGAGNAAEISAQAARFVMGAEP